MKKSHFSFFFFFFPLKTILGIEIEQILNCNQPHHRQSGSGLKDGRKKMPGSISGRACQSSRLKFSLVFSKTCLNTG